jgi:16S rRNA (guanine527-N7)-methyltransferase
MNADVERLVQDALGSANFAGKHVAGLDARLGAYVETLLEANQGINLVSRKDTEKHVGRFLRECLFLARLLEAERKGKVEAAHLLDIGSGGGFPGVVLKLALPAVQVTLVEGTLKKARFLAQVCKQLDLTGVQVLWARAETLSNRESPHFRRDLRHACDWVTAKGLGTVRASMDLAAPFLRPGGVHWTFKGPSYRDELGRCRRRMAQLRLQVHRVEPIPGDQASFLLGLRRLPSGGAVSRETAEIPDGP